MGGYAVVEIRGDGMWDEGGFKGAPGLYCLRTMSGTIYCGEGWGSQCTVVGRELEI